MGTLVPVPDFLSFCNFLGFHLFLSVVPNHLSFLGDPISCTYTQKYLFQISVFTQVSILPLNFGRLILLITKNLNYIDTHDSESYIYYFKKQISKTQMVGTCWSQSSDIEHLQLLLCRKSSVMNVAM